MQLAGGALKAIGGIQQANQQYDALQQQAGIAMEQGFADEQQARRAARQQLGEQAAAFAQAGGGYGGTTANIMEQSNAAANLDALNFRTKGLMKAYGYKVQAKDLKKNAYLSAAGDMLQAAGSQWSQAKQAGA